MELVHFNVRVPKDVSDRLNNLSKKWNLSKQALFAQILSDWEGSKYLERASKISDLQKVQQIAEKSNQEDRELLIKVIQVLEDEIKSLTDILVSGVKESRGLSRL